MHQNREQYRPLVFRQSYLTDIPTFLLWVFLFASFVFVSRVALPPVLVLLSLPASWAREVGYVAVVVLVVAVAVRCWWRSSQQYVLAEKRLEWRHGLFSRRCEFYRYDLIEDVTVFRPFWLAAIGRGHVTIRGYDPSHPVFVLRGIPDPDRVAYFLQDRADKLRSNRYLRGGLEA